MRILYLLLFFLIGLQRVRARALDVKSLYDYRRVIKAPREKKYNFQLVRAMIFHGTRR